MDTDKVIESVLAHHGVRGMKWGVRRKATVGPQEVVISDKRKKIKTSGGQGHPAHPDAIKARTIGQVGKKSGLKSLSDAELKAYSNRLQMEQNVKRLNYQEKHPAHRFVLRILGQTGHEQGKNLTNKAATSAGKAALAMALA